MALEEYRRKRKFSATPEPPPEIEKLPKGAPRFVIQKHHATHLHYDFRLEMGGVLKSWAIPKGPTLDPNEKRLAMMVEDHPVDYIDVEGIIPAGNYGAGAVMVWDTGTWESARGTDPEEGLKKGDLKFILHGEKLKGEFALVRMRSRRPGSRGNEWLMLKKKDQYAQPGWDPAGYDWSVLTKRSLEQIAEDEGSGTWENSPKSKVQSPKSEEMAKRAAAQRSIEMERARKAKQISGSKVQGPAVDPSKLPGAVKAAMPDKIDPMLAALVGEPQEGPDWWYEIKWDGVRAIAFLDNGKVRLQSRSHRDITACYPDLAGIEAAFRGTAPSRDPQTDDGYSPSGRVVSVAALSDSFNARRAVLDGEIVTLDEEGRSSFARLQQRMNLVPDQRLMHQYPVIYYVFDLLYLDGYDLRRVPLEQRKEALRAILADDSKERIRYSEHLEGQGQELAKAAAERGLEGIVGKRRDSLYEGRRSREWQKIKTVQEAEAVIGGYTEPRGARQYFGSLVLGEWRDGTLVHVGNAGTGFTQASQKAVWERLKPLRTDRNPFAGKVRALARAHWVRPELRARVKFAEWTNDHKMRAPVVLEVLDPSASEALWSAGLDPDGLPVRVAGGPSPGVRERTSKPDAFPYNSGRIAGQEGPAARRPALHRPALHTLFSGDKPTQVVEVDGRVMEIKNLNKVFFPADGYTKRDVLEYYYRIADYLLPYMKDRPLTLKRYPDGIHGPYFYQKNVRKAVPGWVPTVCIKTEHGHHQYIEQVLCNDRATLVYLANLGCIDHHAWLSRAGSLDKPDFVLFDLDPGEKVRFDQLLEVVHALREKLEELGMEGYPKTSGATGMHVWVPLVNDYSYEDTRNFAQLVYELVLPEMRDMVTFERSLSRRRKDRVYLDYAQNGIAKSVPPPYSLRPHDGAPVSTPLDWKEMKKGLDPGEYNIKTIWKRLAKHGDLCRGALDNRQRLEPALQRAQEQLEVGSATVERRKRAS